MFTWRYLVMGNPAVNPLNKGKNEVDYCKGCQKKETCPTVNNAHALANMSTLQRASNLQKYRRCHSIFIDSPDRPAWNKKESRIHAGEAGVQY
jgi:hypothetical protein